jgi:hypothetical protein
MPINNADNIFQDLPDGLGEEEFYFGTYVLGIGGMNGIEVARAFAEAANRLLTEAAAQREGWEAAYPILFCYRHALELYLKALLPNSRHGHNLGKLAKALKPIIEGRYAENDVTWLLDRIAEFDRIDPKSTIFRYHDGSETAYKLAEHPNLELWVDFRNLRQKVTRMFKGLEKVLLDSYHR